MKTCKIKNSSNISEIGHNEKKNIMEITFHNNKTYHYYRVSKRVYEAFLKADSKGKYFHARIKGVYAYKKLEQK